MTAPPQDGDMLAGVPEASTASCGGSTPTRSRRSPRRRRRRGCGTARSCSSATRKVEASFADHRTYIYKGKEVDQQVHLGFDLAVTEHVPVVAANGGKVLNASWLGIYGNCVDHRSRHGRAVAVRPPVVVRREGRRHGDRGQTIGRSGMTGLAGGDHLHFTMLVGGQMVNPVEWWDPHWMPDRVERKLREAAPIGTNAR